MIGNAEVVAAGLEEIDPLKGTETRTSFYTDDKICVIIRRDRSPKGDGSSINRIFCFKSSCDH